MNLFHQILPIIALCEKADLREGSVLWEGVEGPVEIVPLLIDLDVRCIHTVRIMDCTPMRPTPLIQLWRLPFETLQLPITLRSGAATIPGRPDSSLP